MDARFIKHFDIVIESCKVGIRKPDPRIYQMACEKLGVDPHNVRYIIHVFMWLLLTVP